MANYNFVVMGRPKGKGRPRFARRGNFVTTYTPKETEEYEEKIRLAFREKYRNAKPLSGNISIKIMACFGVPKGTSKKKTAELLDTPYPKKPDADNISKIVLDSLNTVAFEDDNAVVRLEVTKFYAATEYIAIAISGEENEQ